MRANERRDRRIRQPALLAAGLLTLAGAAQAAGPSFDCGNVKKGSVEGLGCQDPTLAAGDRKLAEVYAAAAKEGQRASTGTQGRAARLDQRARRVLEERGQAHCVLQSYRLRAAELQARYRLLPPIGATYVCDGQPGDEVTATFFAISLNEKGEWGLTP